jgi:hypothetical protein
MSISDTFDQLLRALVASSSSDLSGAEGSDIAPPGAPPQDVERGARPDPAVADLEALVAEVELKRAHELDRSQRESEVAPATDTSTTTNTGSRVDRLETSAGAVENLGLGFHLGAAIERIALAAGEGGEGGPRLREAAWLIERYITLLEARPTGAEIHASSDRLAQTGGTIAADVHELASELAPVPEPAPDGDLESPPEPRPSEPADETTPLALGVASPAPAQIVHELPSIQRELFVTALRAGIAVAAITAVVLVLTLIAQWH